MDQLRERKQRGKMKSHLVWNSRIYAIYFFPS